MTYFLSVSSAVTNKRTLARSIWNLGNKPQKVAETFLTLNTSYSYQQLLVLQEMIDRHGVNHQAYPVIHFYSHPEPGVCLSINLARLDEAVSILLTSEKGKSLQKELRPLRSSLTNFLNHIERKFPRSLSTEEEPAKPLSLPYEIEGANIEELQRRRKILGGLLNSEGFNWQDVR